MTKTTFNKLSENKGDYGMEELSSLVNELTSEILKTDKRLLSVDKNWSNYGTWKSKGFANEYYFGEELASILTKALTGRITHDEDKEFEIDEFEERISELIFEYLYHY